MTTIRIPTPLRDYTGGEQDILVEADSVRAALQALVSRYPALSAHLYNGDGQLRPYVNLFVNEQDVRDLQGTETALQDEDRLMILPSIAGGGEGSAADASPRRVDYSALRTNQAAIIALLLAAFIIDSIAIVALVGLAMLVGTLLGIPGFVPLYRTVRAAGWISADVVSDNPEPHRFSQALGSAVLIGATAALLGGLSTLGWALGWLVIALAALNLFGGFCVGCAMYYWLGRAGLPGFGQPPPPGTTPGRRPSQAG